MVIGWTQKSMHQLAAVEVWSLGTILEKRRNRPFNEFAGHCLGLVGIYRHITIDIDISFAVKGRIRWGNDNFVVVWRADRAYVLPFLKALQKVD